MAKNGDELPPGVYESVLTTALEARLASLVSGSPFVSDLRPSEAPDRLALHLRDLVRSALETQDEWETKEFVEFLNEVIAVVEKRFDHVGAERPLPNGQVLRAIRPYNPDGSPREFLEPLTPLLDTALLTNSHGEPHIGKQLDSEIDSADSIDVVMAFVRRTGIRPLLARIRKHCEAGRQFRLLTTTYTNSTEASALKQLLDAGAQVKVSYDTTGTRLHAKSWIFHRHSRASTAFIGSSNLTHQAQHTGKEWNLRVSGMRNPDVIRQLATVFETYWEGGDFQDYDADDFARATAAARTSSTTYVLPAFEVRLHPFQERLLEEIRLSRELGHRRNLLVSATGTGKTVMAAMDYAGLRESLPGSRLLFVAHREEILDQSLATFRHVLRQPSFGEKWVGGHRPSDFDHVFASIQSLSANGLAQLDPAHFDVVIIDEFHHAAAPSYRALLDSVRPAELLGMTATPERADGQSIADLFFDGRIAAELRLWDAIDQERLAPFTYYGINDGLDLRQVPWRRGRGYEVSELEKLYTANDHWARLVISELLDRVDDPEGFRALGFCVGVAHAEFMADHFRRVGIPAVAITGGTAKDEREGALADLRDGKVRVVFSVDLFNEGVDVPTVDTLLMLRPTESGTVFLQQLGRGLRRDPGKTHCLVLDFVGHHRSEFRYDQRFNALFRMTRRQLQQQVERGFPLLPSGCHMELDAVAAKRVLDSIKTAIPTNHPGRVAELRAMAANGEELTLANFLHHSGCELADVYSSNRGWSDLLEAAGVPVLPAGPEETKLRKSIGRMLHINDRVRLDHYSTWLSGADPDLTHEYESRLVRMLCIAVLGESLCKDLSLADALALVREHPQIVDELSQVLELLAVDHVGGASHDVDVPLRVHAQYTRLEMLAALTAGTDAAVPYWKQSGVKWLAAAKADVFAFTLDKTQGHFSPTTRYNDYAISTSLIHWESQSSTSPESPVGRRYRGLSESSTPLLFCQVDKSTSAYWYLGPATYVSHTGSKPMAITWRLHTELSGDLFAQFAAVS